MRGCGDLGVQHQYTPAVQGAIVNWCLVPDKCRSLLLSGTQC